jgi:bacillithiol biosynthesis cysteine-adding enzyme BshC
VATGQQVGFLGGPLYVAWKAATAIRLARWIEATSGTPAVAVFWVASEDHDAAEIREFAWPGEGEEPLSSTLPLELGRLAAESIPMSEALRGSMDAALERLAPKGETPAFREAAEIYGSAPDLGAAGARLLARAFGRHGLVVVEPRAVRPLAQPIFERELAAPGESARRVKEAGEGIRALGFKPRLRGPRDANLFVLREGERLDIGSGEGAVPLEEAREIARRNPERLSAGVVLRPVVQDYLFGTRALVAGPAETAYLGQLRGVYEHMSVAMPAIVPRFSAAMIDGGLLAQLDERGLDPGRIAAGGGAEELLTGVPGEAAVEALAHASERAFSELERIVSEGDPLERKLRKSRARMDRELARIRDRLRSHAVWSDPELADLVNQARFALRPAGKPQERVFGWAHSLAVYGQAWIDGIVDAAEPFEPGPWLLVSGGGETDEEREGGRTDG